MSVSQSIRQSYHVTKRKEEFFHTKSSIKIFMAALFKIAPKWEQPTCSPTDEVINKMKLIYKTVSFGNEKR